MAKKRFKKIYIEITNCCNLSCPFCPPTIRKKEFMTKEHFLFILDQIKNYTDYIYLHVKGEPLLHPDINEFIDLAYEKGFQINLTTNGTLLDRLKTKHIRQINYSIQSDETIEQVRRIVQQLKHYVKDTSIYVSLRLWSEQSKENESLKQLLVEEFDSISDTNDLKDKCTLDKSIFLSIESQFEWPTLDSKNSSSIGTCYALRDHIAILVDGSVVPCCLDNNGTIFLGSIYETDLETILRTERAQVLLQGFQNHIKKEELCRNCNFLK